MKLLAIIIAGLFISCNLQSQNHDTMKDENQKYEVSKSEEEWKKELNEEEFQVLRKKGTEPAFSGEFYLHDEKGTYLCAACGNELFPSETKYKSGSGWPSFYKPIDKEHIVEKEDRSFGMTRTEVICSRCGSHLGHVFPDGPEPTGLRYCINSISLDFKEKE